jgi:predicted nuclease with TOPRIM domain
MNSEKVKEIKKVLEICQKDIRGKCKDCPYECRECDLVISRNSLTLINELESENETIRLNMQETEKASFNINQMNGNLVIENQQLKDRIAELEKENAELKVDLKKAIDMQNEFVQNLETATKEVEKNLAREIPNLLKQFAERLIEKKIKLGDRFNIYDIDETLKEFIDG